MFQSARVTMRSSPIIAVIVLRWLSVRQMAKEVPSSERLATSV